MIIKKLFEDFPVVSMNNNTLTGYFNYICERINSNLRLYEVDWLSDSQTVLINDCKYVHFIINTSIITDLHVYLYVSPSGKLLTPDEYTNISVETYVNPETTPNYIFPLEKYSNGNICSANLIIRLPDMYAIDKPSYKAALHVILSTIVAEGIANNFIDILDNNLNCKNNILLFIGMIHDRDISYFNGIEQLNEYTYNYYLLRYICECMYYINPKEIDMRLKYISYTLNRMSLDSLSEYNADNIAKLVPDFPKYKLLYKGAETLLKYKDKLYVDNNIVNKVIKMYFKHDSNVEELLTMFRDNSKYFMNKVETFYNKKKRKEKRFNRKR